MRQHKLPKKIYIIFILFVLHIIFVSINSDLWGNILSSAVAFFSSYVIYSSVKKRPIKETDLTWYFLFIFSFSWGIFDFLWLVSDSLIGLADALDYILYLYTIGSVILAFLSIYVYGKIHKKWNKYQMIIDIFSICSILIILLWTFIFSKTNIRFETSLDFFTTITFMLCDFVVLSTYLILYFSSRKTKTPLSFIIVFSGILVYVSADFYFAYLDIMDLYNPNSLIDAAYTFTLTMFAFGSYYRSIRPVSTAIQTIDEEMLPYNYGNSKNFTILSFILLIGLFYSKIGIQNYLLIMLIAVIHQFLTRYIQISIKTEILLKKEQYLNEYLEHIIEEKISDLKLANIALLDLSNKDNLTNLYNRRYFLKQMDNLIHDSNCKNFALLYMDMDRFKAINDSHGHEIGDQVLINLSKRFIDKCQDKCNIYRIGGDEFAVIIEDYISNDKLNIIVDTLLTLSQQPILISPYIFNVNLSVGISQYPLDATDRGTLLKYADIAMYEAKTSHLNKKFFFFDSRLNEQIQRKHKLEAMLQNADYDNEFQLYFQPQYSIQEKNILVGMEALLRWFHPEEGFISPGEFIPIAEEIGVIFSLGEWVVNKATQQIKAWNTNYNTNLQIGINISPTQIENTDFINKIRHLIHEEQINPEWIDIEITEGVAMSSQVSMEEVFSGLASIGISISIDDFGTGYSSLSYIKRFDIDRLKIAKELIDNISEDKNTRLIIKAIIMMAKGMGLKTIAEGVEEISQYNILKELGCDEIQGYLLGRPVPYDIFESEHIANSF